jgi:hypothetical protein
MNSAKANGSMIARLAAVLACMIASVAFATPAAADTPVRHQFPNNSTAIAPDVCAFPIDVEIIATWTETSFFDRSGNLTRISDHIDEQDILRANGKTLVGLPFKYNVDIPFKDGNPTKIVITGEYEKIRLPDGTLYFAAGWSDLLTHGGATFTFLPDRGGSGNVAALCAALAP